MEKLPLTVPVELAMTRFTRRNGWRFAALVAVFFVVFDLSMASAAHRSDETEIRSVLQSITDAYRVLNPNQAMAPYVRSPDLVVFDLSKPRQDIGYAANLAKTEAFMKGAAGPIRVEWSDVNVVVDHAHAYLSALLLVDAAMKTGTHLSMIGRTTMVFERSHGHWLIMHEHDSVPLP